MKTLIVVLSVLVLVSSVYAFDSVGVKFLHAFNYYGEELPFTEVSNDVWEYTYTNTFVRCALALKIVADGQVHGTTNSVLPWTLQSDSPYSMYINLDGYLYPHSVVKFTVDGNNKTFNYEITYTNNNPIKTASLVVMSKGVIENRYPIDMVDSEQTLTNGTFAQIVHYTTIPADELTSRFEYAIELVGEDWGPVYSARAFIGGYKHYSMSVCSDNKGVNNILNPVLDIDLKVEWVQSFYENVITHSDFNVVPVEYDGPLFIQVAGTFTDPWWTNDQHRIPAISSDGTWQGDIDITRDVTDMHFKFFDGAIGQPSTDDWGEDFQDDYDLDPDVSGTAFMSTNELRADNIVINELKAGTYTFTFNYKTLAYSVIRNDNPDSKYGVISVVGNMSGWGDLDMIQTATNKRVWEKRYILPSDTDLEFKFRADRHWFDDKVWAHSEDDNTETVPAAATLIQPGTNIFVSNVKAGGYIFTFNEYTGEYSLKTNEGSFYTTMSLAGEMSSWDDVDMKVSDSNQNLWEVDYTFPADTNVVWFKFRANRDWKITWGHENEVNNTTAPSSGTLLQPGMDIYVTNVTAGTYTFTLNEITGEYTMIGKDQDPPIDITSIAMEGGKVRLIWKSINGEKYEIQASSDVTKTDWPVAKKDIPADGTSASSDLTPGDKTKFYRVKKQ